MTIKVPNIDIWSASLAHEIEVDNKLLTDETTTQAELRRLRSLNGIDENREARAAMYAAGKTPTPVSSINTQLDEAITRLSDIQLARELNADKRRKLRISEGTRLCQDELKSPYDASAKKFADNLASIYGFLLEADQLKSSLMCQSVGFYPTVCNLDTEPVFGSPLDPGSPIVRLLRECVHFRYLSRLPAGLR
jgi:hypothetical protein